MKTPGPGHLPVSALLHALVITGKRHVTRLFGFKLSQTALFVQTAFYLLGFYVVILNHKRYFLLLQVRSHSYFVSFGRSQSVLKIPVSEFVHFQVLSPALADRVEEPPVPVPVSVPVPVQGRDLLVDVVAPLALLLPVPRRNGGK